MQTRVHSRSIGGLKSSINNESIFSIDSKRLASLSTMSSRWVKRQGIGFSVLLRLSIEAVRMEDELICSNDLEASLFESSVYEKWRVACNMFT